MRGRLRFGRAGRFCAASVILFCAGGCIVEGPLSVRRAWFDYNTLKTPALYYEKIHRMPPDSARVKQMRWMYGKSPGRDDLPLTECDTDNPADTFIPDDAQPPQRGYEPLPAIPGAFDDPLPKPKDQKPDSPPHPSGIDTNSTATKSMPRTRDAVRTAARHGTWRFTAGQ